jgi:hypothetical protein
MEYALGAMAKFWRLFLYDLDTLAVIVTGNSEKRLDQSLAKSMERWLEEIMGNEHISIGHIGSRMLLFYCSYISHHLIAKFIRAHLTSKLGQDLITIFERCLCYYSI